jgi:trimeric autotransporter adhesin
MAPRPIFRPFQIQDGQVNPAGREKEDPMNSTIRSKTITLSIALIACALLSLGVLPGAQGVVPPPDGGYANFTTAEGTHALQNLTTGAANTAVGWYSLFSDTTTNFNTGVGAGTLVLNTGNSNTAVGAAALLVNTTGYDNTANGAFALFSNTTAVQNTAFGSGALYSNTTGAENTALGAGALAFNNADFNTAVGVDSLSNNTAGSDNTAVGSNSLFSNVVGSGNTATGSSALYNNTNGANTADGNSALWANTVGYYNTAVGYQALYSNTSGFSNAAIGANALYDNTEGMRNTAVGVLALSNNITGSSNTAVGHSALFNDTGSDNTAIGINAGLNLTTGSGNVCIGEGVGGAGGESNVTRIRNIGSTPIIDGTSVVIGSTGGLGDGILGYPASSRRYKEDIKPMDKASETLFALKPVTFRAKGNMNRGHVKHYGLLAEDVAAVAPDLVVYNPEGKPETLRFDSINAMLLNEFLKEHRKVEQQQATIAKLGNDVQRMSAQQQEEVRALRVLLTEQAAQLEKVSAQLELSRRNAEIVTTP